MRGFGGAFGIAAALMFGAAASAHAADVDLGSMAGNELRVGALMQNAEGTGSEHGNTLNIEKVFASPFVSTSHGAWAPLLEPRPHLGVSVNLDGQTSKVYAGFTWDFQLGHGVFLETSLGAALHDGILDDPVLDSFGCPVNFRESLSLGYNVTQRVSVMVMVDHMSNANLCNRNRGLTNAGVRLGYALD
jgi:lipid A 3-O-deacylase